VNGAKGNFKDRKITLTNECCSSCICTRNTFDPELVIVYATKTKPSLQVVKVNGAQVTFQNV
ncbi:hypothetical protein SK128_017349, partial [Halocaridina rubra]